MMPELALETAHDLACQIGANALWDGARCNWLSQTSDIFLGARLPAAGMCGPNLYDGTAGTALFLAECYGQTGDRVIAGYAEGAIRHALSRSCDIPERFALGLYTGQAGIALAAMRAGRLLARDDIAHQGSALMEGLFDLDLDGRCIMDVMVGLGGTIPAVLSERDALDEARMLEAVTRWGDALLALAETDPRGASWNTMAEMRSGLESIGADAGAMMQGQCCAPNLLGLGHGASGIGLALMEIAALTGDARFARCAEASIAYETSWFDEAEGVWPDLRKGADLSAQGEAPVAWCHGAAGIGLTRFRLWQLTGNRAYRADAVRALEMTADMLVRHLGEGANWSLCHGMLGNLDLLLDTGSTIGRSYAPVIEQVLDFGRREFAGKRRPWVYDTPTAEALPGLMLGGAGTGYAYLRASAPDSVPSVLRIGPEQEIRRHTSDTKRAGPQAAAQEVPELL